MDWKLNLILEMRHGEIVWIIQFEATAIWRACLRSMKELVQTLLTVCRLPACLYRIRVQFVFIRISMQGVGDAYQSNVKLSVFAYKGSTRHYLSQPPIPSKQGKNQKTPTSGRKQTLRLIMKWKLMTNILFTNKYIRTR